MSIVTIPPLPIPTRILVLDNRNQISSPDGQVQLATSRYDVLDLVQLAGSVFATQVCPLCVRLYPLEKYILLIVWKILPSQNHTKIFRYTRNISQSMTDNWTLK